ncbi:glycosyltransferase [Bradyrhizobium symbiodeficiens]|uniref:glycosyltransferase n=1 Tax=Bradyrhizobium symbiodeficiens TaxID=1404367 RepID=UPI00140FE986|nr:glycosyltransferase [Bradyrhizobium symbiodeficiens]QIP01740.1 glycosyltransferase [Bradyrhizobium symbiodeficiens]
MNAPIIVFAYKRPRHLARVLEALARNPGADQSVLFVYCDGAKRPEDASAVAETRRIARAASGFERVEIIARESNFGLSRSIIEGVGEVCERFGRAIVLEDDVVPTPYFLNYVNEALDVYADDERVLSIGCHTFDAGMELPETFFLDIPDCWGWGVWQRSWTSFNEDGATLLAEIVRRNAQDAFDFGGAYPYTRMLEEQVMGLNQSWAIRWYAHAFLSGGLVLYPRRAVTRNIGFDGSGTHGGGPGGYGSVQCADGAIHVVRAVIEESPTARLAWRLALQAMASPSWQGIGGSIKQNMRRVYRGLKPYLSKAWS